MNVFLLGTLASVMNMIALEGSVTYNWGTIDITPITDAIMSIIPVALPAVIAIAGIRKAISFLVGMIRSA